MLSDCSISSTLSINRSKKVHKKVLKMSGKLFVFIVLIGISYTLAFPTKFSNSIVENGGNVIIIIRKIRQVHQPQIMEGGKPSLVDVTDEQTLGNFDATPRLWQREDNRNTDDGTNDDLDAFANPIIH